MRRSRSPERLARPSSSTSCAVVKKRTARPALTQAVPTATARWVLPRPVGPRNTKSSARSTKESDMRSAGP